MSRIRVGLGLAALAAAACQETAAPTAPAETAVAPAAAVAPCPCWDEAALATAFPAIHAFVSVDGSAALTRFDVENAQQIQALVRLAVEGPGSCELASFGTGGLVEVLQAAEGLTPAQCEACAGLLQAPATANGFVFQPEAAE